MVTTCLLLILIQPKGDYHSHPHHTPAEAGNMHIMSQTPTWEREDVEVCCLGKMIEMTQAPYVQGYLRNIIDSIYGNMYGCAHRL